MYVPEPAGALALAGALAERGQRVGGRVALVQTGGNVSDRWALRLAMREQAIAQPFKNFEMPEETAPEVDLRAAANDARPEPGTV